MIYGIGTDICDVRRIAATLARRGERFAEKVLGPHEIAVFRGRRAKVEARGVSYLATRFSAKEAFSKAIGMGMRMPMTWRDCEVVKAPSGKPEIRLHGALAAWFEQRGFARPRHRHRRDRLRGELRRRRIPRPRMTAAIAHAPLVLDVAGLELDAADRRRLAHPLTGGVILFSRNWQSRLQLTELTSAIKSIRPDLLICVDHEGGRVQRFRTDGYTHLPPMRVLGDLWLQDGRRGPGSGAMAAMEAATAAGYVLASELRACGVDLSFTPVLDLDHGPSAVIGDRTLHRDPRVVAVLAKSLMHGLLLAGMHNCGKHFPGHGYVAADSHLAIPVDKRALKAILADDARPYEWLGGALSSVMPAHVIYPKVDALPAGFSARWLKDILRLQLGFNGAIFSDDLSMAGARRVNGADLTYTEAATLALGASCDLVLLCNQSLDGGKVLDRTAGWAGRGAGAGPLAGRSGQRGPAPRPAAADRPDPLGRPDAPAGLPARARAPALIGRSQLPGHCEPARRGFSTSPARVRAPAATSIGLFALPAA